MAAPDWLNELKPFPRVNSVPLAVIGSREPLDAIDLAYAEGDRPWFVARVQTMSDADTDAVRSLLMSLERSGLALLLPAHVKLELLPRVLDVHPFELARWADDGGRV